MLKWSSYLVYALRARLCGGGEGVRFRMLFFLSFLIHTESNVKLESFRVFGGDVPQNENEFQTKV